MNSLNTQYLRRSRRYCLPENGVHIWKAGLKISSENVMNIMHLLSPDERKRANRFYFQRHKMRYVACRGLLRILISWYLGVDPIKIKFAYRKNGKPFLESSNHPENLFFNVSHSKELALYVFAHSPLVGIDVEYIEHDCCTEELAKHFYHRREQDLLDSLPVDQKKKEFYNLWTCKEAYLKATGDGLAGLEKVEILDCNKKQVLIHNGNGKSQVLKEWLLKRLVPEIEFSAALAIKGHCWDINYRDISIVPFLFNR